MGRRVETGNYAAAVDPVLALDNISPVPNISVVRVKKESRDGDKGVPYK